MCNNTTQDVYIIIIGVAHIYEFKLVLKSHKNKHK